VKLHSDDGFTPQDVPWRFEAGTPNIEGVVGLGAAVAYLRRIGMEEVHRHSQTLGERLVERLGAVPNVEVLAGSAPMDRRIGLATFVVRVPGLAQENVARLLCDRHQILVSGGYHCAHILHHRLHLDGTVRASTHVFNTQAEIDRLVDAVREIVEG
jgi:cysteine desulfurase/selenocysteine lyase